MAAPALNGTRSRTNQLGGEKSLHTPITKLRTIGTCYEEPLYTYRYLSEPKSMSSKINMILENSKNNGQHNTSEEKNIADHGFPKFSEIKSSQVARNNFTCTSETSENKSNTGKELYEAMKERKACAEKVATINNRLKKIKEQEEIIIRKNILAQAKIAKDDYIRVKKIENKNYINSTKVQREKQKEEMKNKVREEAVKRKECLQKTYDAYYERKKQAFHIARTDRLLLDSMLTQFNSHFSNINNYRCVKLKQELIQFKTEKFKRQAEREGKIKEIFNLKIARENQQAEELRNQLKELEVLEERSLEKLKNTMSLNNEMENKQLLNSSMAELTGHRNTIDVEHISANKSWKNPQHLATHKKSASQSQKVTAIEVKSSVKTKPEQSKLKK